MNRKIHAGFIGLAALGILLTYAGYLGLKDPIHCGDVTCQEAHP